MAYKLSGNKYLGFGKGETHYYEIVGRDSTSDTTTAQEDVNKWKDAPIDLGEYKVIPYGSSNDIPDQIRDAIFPNHLAPRIQNRKVELLFEQGPFLFEEVQDGRNLVREPVVDNEITDWLESIEYQQILIERSIEYYNNEQLFAVIKTNRSRRLGLSNAIEGVECLSNVRSRLAYMRGDSKKQPTHVIVGDWQNAGRKEEFQVYPIWDRKNPTKHPFAVHKCAFTSFGVDHYIMPSTYGVLPWIKRSTTIPKLIEKLTDNSLNIRYHITSPAEYWIQQEDKLKKKAEADGLTYTDKMLEDLYHETMDKLSEVLSGVDNVGKFWHNQTVTRVIGASAVEEGWKINPIKQEIKEYVESQIAVADKSDFATQAGLGLHAALAYVGADGKSDSGSEQKYAVQIHQTTSTAIPEYYVTKVFNDIIPIKFGRKVRLGFYHLPIAADQDTSLDERFINQSR